MKMVKITDMLPFVFLVIAFFVCLIDLSDALGEACGTFLGAQLYCNDFYHCCDKDASTCCATGYVCGGTICISIAAIIIPCIIVFVIVVVVIVLIVKKNKAHTGVVVNPGQPHASGYPPPGQYPMGQPGYSQSQQTYPPPPKY